MKFVLLEGRIDMYYMKKMYELIGYEDDVFYFPCGGASEMWPVAEALKWRWDLEQTKVEAWVDNDEAGLAAKAILNKSFPSIKVRILSEHKELGSIENEIGFMSPIIYEEYKRIEKIKQDRSKDVKTDYKILKERLYVDVMSRVSICEEGQAKIKNFFKKMEIL